MMAERKKSSCCSRLFQRRRASGEECVYLQCKRALAHLLGRENYFLLGRQKVAMIPASVSAFTAAFMCIHDTLF